MPNNTFSVHVILHEREETKVSFSAMDTNQYVSFENITDHLGNSVSNGLGLNIFLQAEQEDGETKLFLCANADVVNKMIFNTVNAGATCNVLPVSGATFADLKIIRNDTTCLRPTPRHSVSSVEWNDGFPISNQNN